ncbi:hypothetical protein Phi10:1_gp004 [Cellulophaga phage phi10:1]|uniref:Lipoprotein n=1 Tax=Cellulophaga phage phi10:1 TaxID=1327981 RepID=S0A0K7_9CAUD|nr:hypothetical protein Phi10:1_gp004 [Cellulophaga phage phi10:1]AGO48345.1 hypothetical protein Phi10:1_gp004 [Cellulophaga phage phi10:1]
MKKLTIFASVLLIMGCRAKKEVLHTISEKKIDSVYIKKTKEVSPPILSSLVIEEICDSVTALPKQFKQVYIIKNDTIRVEVKDNNLQLDFNKVEALISQKDSIVKVKESEIKELKETSKTTLVTNWRLVIILSLVIIVFIVFPKIPTTINNLFKKLI